jgi:hypothetical protein
MSGSQWLAGGLAWLLLAALPASNNFQLNSYGFGNGGTASSSSSTYKVNGLAGEVAGSQSSTSYTVGAGEAYEKQAHVPTITLTNDANWYNKLKLVIGPENNPSDATFAVAISSDGFTTTQYVKSDFTVGSTLTTADYLTYAGWGSAAGEIVRGLTNNTLYSVKAKAYRGSFTESAYGPVSTAATVNPQIVFDIDVDAADVSTNPPYEINFGNLLPGVVADSPERVWVSLDTNAESGAKVYVNGQNAGLHSVNTAYTITSATGDISSLNEGFGVQGASATQTADGPLSLVAPYNGAGQNVGIADTFIRDIFTTPNPVTGGRGSFILKAKSMTMTPASSDYSEVLTAIAAGSF